MKKLLCLVASLFLVSQPLIAQQPASQPAQQTPPPAPRPATNTQTQYVAVEELLPADTLAFVSTSNLAGLMENFRRLDAIKVLEARLPKAQREKDSPITEFLRELSFGIEDAHALDATRIAVAVFKPEKPAAPDNPGSTGGKSSDKGQPEATRQMKAPDVRVAAFVASPDLPSAQKARTQFITFFSDNFEDLGKLSDVKPTTLAGTTVDKFSNGFAGAMIGTTYAIGHPGAIETVLTLRDARDAARLSDNADFTRARSQLSSATGLFAYINGKPVTEMISSEFAPIVRQMWQLDSALTDFFAFESVAFSSTFDREGIVDRLALNLNPAKPSLLKAIFSGPSGEAKAARLIPAGTEIVWTHSVDWPTFYDKLIVPMVFQSIAAAEFGREVEAQVSDERKAYENQVEEAVKNKRQPPPMPDQLKRRYEETVTPKRLEEATQAVIARYEKDLGFKMRDELAKDFGHEFAVAYNIPKLKVNAQPGKLEKGGAALIGIRDREAARAAFLKLLTYTVLSNVQQAQSKEEDKDETNPATDGAKPKAVDATAAMNLALAMMPRENYKQAEILSVMSFAAIAFTDEYIIIADSKETVKQMLDTPESGASMIADANYRRAMGSTSGVSQLFITPQYFDEVLNRFVRNWAGDQAAEAALTAFQLSVPATAAASLDTSERGLQLEAFSPLGIPGMIALDEFASGVQSRARVNEYDARTALRQLVQAEQVYAKAHAGRYATLDALAKEKLEGVSLDLAKLQAKDQAYTFELKLKGNGKGFEATATPVKYGRRARLSFFADESGRVHRADKNGAPATAADEDEPQESPPSKGEN